MSEPVAPGPAPHPPRTVLLVRHGRTAWNAAGRYQGQADVPLDEVGEAQAVHLADALVDLAPAAIVISDLRRARDTAAPLAGRLGIRPTVDPRLREADVGAWEGLTVEEAASRFPGEYAAWRDGTDVARGGGETRAAAGERAAAAIVGHARGLDGGATLVVVSHGLVLRAAVTLLGAAGHCPAVADPPHLGNTEWLALTVAV